MTQPELQTFETNDTLELRLRSLLLIPEAGLTVPVDKTDGCVPLGFPRAQIEQGDFQRKVPKFEPLGSLAVTFSLGDTLLRFKNLQGNSSQPTPSIAISPTAKVHTWELGVSTPELLTDIDRDLFRGGLYTFLSFAQWLIPTAERR
jgi:hypothetical protein